MLGEQPRSTAPDDILTDNPKFLGEYGSDELFLPHMLAMVVTQHDLDVKIPRSIRAWRCHECLLIPNHHVWLLWYYRNGIDDL